MVHRLLTTVLLVFAATACGTSPESPKDASADASDASPIVATNECASPKPEWIFCSGFEEADWHPVWDDYDGNPAPTNVLVSVPGPSNDPQNHAMRLRVTPDQSGGADLVKVLAAHDRLYARWYVQYEPGFNFAARNHGSGLFGGDRNDLGQSGNRPTGSDFMFAGLDYATDTEQFPHAYHSYVYYPGMYEDCVDPAGSCWGDSLPCTYDTGATYCTNPIDLPTVIPPALVAGRWYCVEEMLDAGTPSADGSTATGGLDFWLDGQELAPSQLHHWMRSSAIQPNLLWLQLFHHDGTHSVEGVIYDDVVVSTARIGCN